VTYDYVCRSCGKEIESDTPLSEGIRHIIGDGVVCGLIRRNWKSINLNRVPGGGRTHRG
jgi:hypothetical protein